MVYYTVRSKVADFRQWREHFDATESTRRAAGATGSQQVFRDLQDPDSVVAILEWDTAENARRYLADPSVKRDSDGSGVIGDPDIFLLHQV